MFKYFVAFSVICVSLVCSEEKKVISVSLVKGDAVLHNELNPNWVARGVYEDAIEKEGWTYLEVETNPQYPDTYQSYYAGFLEGAATHEVIYNSWRNMQEGFCNWHEPKFCDNLRSYLKQNFNWMKSQISKFKNSAYWHQVDLILAQLTGLYKGYNKKTTHPISQEDFLWMNLSGDMLDLSLALAPKNKSSEPRPDGRCSALIKILPGNADLLVSQVTWSVYQSMLRVQKKYIFPFLETPSSDKTIPGHTVVFSSYPAYLSSGDDFHLLSTGLATLETTIGNSNPYLWVFVQPTGQVQEWIRVIVANRLATTGKEWSETFKQYNSGTYNNQWMVVDYKKFTPGKPVTADTLWVIEQLPGFVQDGDQSEILEKQTYWPSYNVPFYQAVFVLSGVPAYVKKYGNWFSYDDTPRALIFRRDHSKVTDMKSLIKLMRYNDYQNDPLSRCNCTPPFSAENAVSARGELNPKEGTYPFSALEHRNHGGTDVKATSIKLFQTLSFVAISGPTYDQQPVFKWSEQDFANTTPHFGHPDAWKFPLVEHKWVW